jgi:energy-coupling factor transport system ATP-binding protein
MALIVIWPAAALAVDALLYVFADSRKLVLDQVRNQWRGLFHILNNLGLKNLAARGDAIVRWVIDYWYLAIPLGLFFLTVLGVWITRGLATPALRRVRAAFGEHAVDLDVQDPLLAPGPVPVALADVSVRYPGAPSDALHDVSLSIAPSEFVAVVGPNGSGKSTLARVLAGRQVPTDGSIERPGGAGLGMRRGTAFVFQRPEAQVLGVGVRDDIVWGLRDPSTVDVDGILERVGMLELAGRETSTLSGGELQRLALGATLARQPTLLVSDESTAMVDAAGRAQHVRLLQSLARDDGVAVVHVSHDRSEAAAADRIVALHAGEIVATNDFGSAPSPVTHARPSLGAPLIELRNIGHIYSRGTPWAHRALTGVNLVIREHEAVLVVGHNGSGKSTLAWIIAGLVPPSEGERRVVGSVGLSFQHARLQLLRPTVLDEVRVAAGVTDAYAATALAAVGLDPHVFAHRRVDELSGGQMRRVVLADALAARPGVIILDEPFAGLDAQGRRELETVLTNIRSTQGVALVIVAHDRDLPAGLVDRVIELANGRVVADVPADEVTDA